MRTQKLLTLMLVIIIGMAIIPMTNAQEATKPEDTTSSSLRMIDSGLKPINVPAVPAVGPGDKAACEKTGGTWDKNAKLCSGFEDQPITAFLQILGGAILMLSGGIAVIVISVGGVMYITSRGNQQQLEFAKNTLVYGVLGMVVIIFSYFIIRWVLQIIVGL
jgi:Type IV secretion system pilin